MDMCKGLPKDKCPSDGDIRMAFTFFDGNSSGALEF